MRKYILILSFRTCSLCTQPIEQMLIAQDGQGKIQEKKMSQLQKTII
jgi:hypothetical protein